MQKVPVRAGCFDIATGKARRHIPYHTGRYWWPTYFPHIMRPGLFMRFEMRPKQCYCMSKNLIVSQHRSGGDRTKIAPFWKGISVPEPPDLLPTPRRAHAFEANSFTPTHPCETRGARSPTASWGCAKNMRGVFPVAGKNTYREAWIETQRINQEQYWWEGRGSTRIDRHKHEQTLPRLQRNTPGVRKKTYRRLKKKEETM